VRTTTTTTTTRGGSLRYLMTVVTTAMIALVMVNSATVRIMSGSMADTLCAGDYVVVIGMWSVRRFPWLRDLTRDIRGDVVVIQPAEGLQWPGRNRQRPLIKRVVAIGPDRIQVSRGTVIVNGYPIEEPYVRHSPGYDREADLWPVELATSDRGVAIPVGEVFVMGDNRDASLDSRQLGPIRLDNVVGRVMARIGVPGRHACAADEFKQRESHVLVSGGMTHI
jgi:signal peptidase I